jgi:flagellar P-ring protein precursor FlgI
MMSAPTACSRLVSLIAVAALGLAIAATPAAAGDTTVRLRDVASLQGTAPVPLIGYGLVVGLNKTGDRRQTVFSAQTLANMLERFGVLVPGEQIKIENVAAVLVTAELPAFSRRGNRLDVTASSIGDARSLQGGTLLPTPMRGTDGTVYALAQGPLSLGGFGGGKGANSVQVNHLTVGRVPAGGIIQAEIAGAAPAATETILLSLGTPDFTNATRVADAINAEMGPGAAQALDAASVQVTVPANYRGALPNLMARLEPLPVSMGGLARIVINERTGTVVIGNEVRLGRTAVAHGNLSVRISTKYNVSQPSPFSPLGETVVVPDEKIEVTEGEAKLVTLEEGATLDAVVRALNALGATPRDVIAILQAMKAAGALTAELVII